LNQTSPSHQTSPARRETPEQRALMHQALEDPVTYNGLYRGIAVLVSKRWTSIWCASSKSVHRLCVARFEKPWMPLAFNPSILNCLQAGHWQVFSRSHSWLSGSVRASCRDWPPPDPRFPVAGQCRGRRDCASHSSPPNSSPRDLQDEVLPSPQHRRGECPCLRRPAGHM